MPQYTYIQREREIDRDTEKDATDRERRKKPQASQTVERMCGIANLPTSRNALMQVPHIGKIRYRTNRT